MAALTHTACASYSSSSLSAIAAHSRSSVLYGPLLGDEVRRLADLRVVDRVLDPVGDRRVALTDVEPQVQQQPLADLALRSA